MKKAFFTFALSLCLINVFGAHIKGGFFSYEYLGPGINNSNYLRYKITLTVYMVCNATPAQISNPINFSIFSGSTLYANPSVSISSQYNLAKSFDDPCITGNQAVCYYHIVEYTLNSFELPASANGYTIAYQRCCRIDNMENLVSSGTTGNTYTIKIPGSSSVVADAPKNSSPVFFVNDTVVVCGGGYFEYPMGATDKDGDVLSYTLCSALTGATSDDPAPDQSTAPPFQTVNYSRPYSGSQPMGSGVTINSTTGLISGIAPSISSGSNGEFVVTVCVSETRDGKFVASSRKELHIVVKDCIPNQARLDPKGVTCDGFTVAFSNATNLQTGTTYEWTFGDPASGTLNTSTSPTDSHTYSDTGVYIVHLKVTLGGFCQSEDSLVVKVYPGFFPSFTANAPFCKGVPVSFADNTTTNYGVSTGWNWNFGDLSTVGDTSKIKNPSYVYNTAGVYDVTLIVGNTYGCIDTLVKQVVIQDPPLLTLQSKDTTYCSLDTLQLSASGTGNFAWTPGTNILNANTANPLVFPTSQTNYIVSLNQNGCISRDTVTVTPKNDLTNSITASAETICAEDTLTLTGNSNYTNNLSWSWTPVALVESPQLKVTRAFPLTNTTFNLRTTWGKHCVATTTKLITVKQLAVPDAGPDRNICIGQTTAQLTASGGNTYQWTPSTNLSNTSISNPIASPSVTTVYYVNVGVTGCTKTKADSVTVIVNPLPDFTITNDTLICTIDTLQLHSAGVGTVVWTPNFSINNVNSANPLISPDVPTTYYATLTSPIGCKVTDSVKVDVKSVVTLNAGNDTTICRTDSIAINTVSDALQYEWTPATYLSDASAPRPIATPLDASITYSVTGRIGKCFKTDQITIRTVPYPQVMTSNDTTICFGDSRQLLASGGSIYSWSPATFLNATNIPNPLSVRPTSDVRYTVSVTDVLGCPKPATANVWVRVYPFIIANAGPADTTIIRGQPLQLNATGSDIYTWTPSTRLNDPNIASPVATPQNNILYKVRVFNQAGCFSTDSIYVRVYFVPPSFYVPTSFTPNGDGKNDGFKPILLGMRSLNYFRVFNRWGNVVFSTTQIGAAWDGTYKSNPQDPGTYVWMVEGYTYDGELIKKKGTVVLLR